ncbi:prolyl 3-hydroxylase OGFOD1 [Hetaerina americana]|uniref:prolyl 3-hydroxylase OGFOD1 n=1 Tax=Hetaerina americana TaxID=62018 RepID=UPI003A7F13C1
MSLKRNKETISSENDVKIKRVAPEVSLRSQLSDENLKSKLFESWTSGKDLILAPDIEFRSEPFRHCVIRNFCHDADFLEGLKEELYDVEYSEKSNDLYQFHQSIDLGSSQSPHIVSLHNFFHECLIGWLRSVTGIPLNHKIDVTSSRYDYTDVLLCHDDQCEGRRIAFILYMVNSWEKEDGGTLDLFDIDDYGQPDKVARSLVPQWNSIVFFEVSHLSFHQVSEVLTRDKTRLSVSGWFHGPPLRPPTPYMSMPFPRKLPCDGECDEIAAWVNPSYLEHATQAAIRAKFESDSEILLQDFLRPEKYVELAEALALEDLPWTCRGPPNRRNYEISREGLPSIVQSFLKLLNSPALFEFMAAVTELDLLPNRNEEASSSSDEKRRKMKGPACTAEVQRWQHRSYTLVFDKDPTFEQPGLDAVLYFNSHLWTEGAGGQTSYIARDADEELLTVFPVDNALALTYRDKETLRFVKYLNCETEGAFQSIFCTYYE